MTAEELSKLTPAGKRAMIAEYLGIRDVQIGPWYGYDKYGNAKFVPDYLGDINACAEFEKTLTDEQWERYADNLLWMHDTEAAHSNYTAVRCAREAKPERLADAFLLTIP